LFSAWCGFGEGVGCRLIIHINVTAHPTAEWTLQQFREAISGEKPYRYLIHDRDSIYSWQLDSGLKAMGLRILKTPFRAPQANAHCERLVGSIRRECVDFFIPLNEKHLRRTLKEWVDHYNWGRPHSSFGPGIPDSPRDLPQEVSSRYRIPQDYGVTKSILGGLHHEYGLERFVAWKRDTKVAARTFCGHQVVITDNARYHHARLHRDWRQQEAQRFRLDFLPPYSPELNPTERVWKLTRRLCLHNRYFPSLNDVTLAIEAEFANWTESNETLRRLCALT
jgi:transposase